MRSLPRVAALLTLACPVVATAESAQTLTKRDQLVLTQTLLHLVESGESNLTDFDPAGTQVLLAPRTPRKTDFLQPLQLKTDLRDQKVDPALMEDVLARNSSRQPNPRSLDAIDASFKRFKPPAGVVVTEVPNGARGMRGIGELQALYPAARCWVQCYLPGYSGDGNQALVRGLIGPTHRRGSVTCLLKREHGKWSVVWQMITRYH